MNTPKVLHIGVVGSRRRDTDEDYTIVLEAVLNVIDTNPDYDYYVLVSGGCKQGADNFVEQICSELSLPTPIIHWPDKSKLPENPKRWDFAKINYDRNTLIARDSDVLVACVAADRKGGTEDTIKKFKKIHKERYLRDNTILVELEENHGSENVVDRIC